MTSPPSFFARTPTIHTEQEMFQRLAERTGKLLPERRGEVLPVLRDLPSGLPSPAPTSSSGGREVRMPPGKLQQPLGPVASPQPDGSEPSSTSPALTWLPPVKGLEAILTSCGRYSVARAYVHGMASYQAWRRLPYPTRVGEPYPEAKSAREACQRDSEGQ